jgi:hypothetical protein
MSIFSKEIFDKLGPIIQACPICYKLDVYQGDGHNCGQELIRRADEEQR